MKLMRQPDSQALRSESARSGIANQGFSITALVVCALALTGCCPNGQYKTNVSLGEGFANKPNIEVHIVAVNAAEDAQWREYSMTRYWTANESLRDTADKYVMHFGANQPTTQVFNESSKEWKDLWAKWTANKATNLYVLAFIPGQFDDKIGDRDGRRRILPLASCRWKDLQNNEIRVVLTPAGEVVRTPPAAE